MEVVFADKRDSWTRLCFLDSRVLTCCHLVLLAMIAQPYTSAMMMEQQLAPLHGRTHVCSSNQQRPDRKRSVGTWKSRGPPSRVSHQAHYRYHSSLSRCLTSPVCLVAFAPLNIALHDNTHCHGRTSSVILNAYSRALPPTKAQDMRVFARDLRGTPILSSPFPVCAVR